MNAYALNVPAKTLTLAVAAELAQVRKAQGLSQTDLARLSGTTRVSVQRWETGGSIKLSELEKLCEALGEDSTEFFARAVDRTRRVD